MKISVPLLLTLLLGYTSVQAQRRPTTRYVKQSTQPRVEQKAIPIASPSEPTSAPKKADLILSLRNLLNFLAASYIKTDLKTNVQELTAPTIAFTQDCKNVELAHAGQACEWNIASQKKVRDLSPDQVHPGSHKNVAKDKATINAEERLVIKTKEGKKITGTSIGGYQIMLGKPDHSWQEIKPVWSSDNNKIAIAADNLVVIIDVPHMIAVDTFISSASPEQIAVLEKIHTAYRKAGKAELSDSDKAILKTIPAEITKTLKPYIE
jgi:hypothetical protein